MSSDRTRRLRAAIHQAFRAALAVTLAAGLGACDWFTDFEEQPRIEPWEALSDSILPRGNPLNSVPTHGGGVPGYVISYEPAPATIDSFTPLPNPVPPSEESLRDGWKYYAINCAVCHGDTGAGNGSAVRFGMVPISLLGAGTVARTDGYIYGMIRNGRGLMPSYNRIEEMNRWDVVNYVRGLQGRLGAPVRTGAVGQPGQTGDLLPGATPTAPTLPAPFTPEMLTRRAAPRADAAAPGGTPGADTTADVGRLRADTAARARTRQGESAVPPADAPAAGPPARSPAP